MASHRHGGSIASLALSLLAIGAGCAPVGADPGARDAGRVQAPALDASVPRVSVDASAALARCGYDPPPLLPASSLPRCEAATAECIALCAPLSEGGTDCVDACLRADRVAPDDLAGTCGDCLRNAVVACAAPYCEAESIAVRCCLVGCAEGSESCADPRCQRELEALLACQLASPCLAIERVAARCFAR